MWELEAPPEQYQQYELRLVRLLAAIMVNNGAGLDIFYTVRRFADLDPVHIDGWIFRLHYWFTSTALFAASLVAFAKQYFGDPIECIFVR